MRLTTRTDLGGYAVGKGLADVEVTKPFVLLCGPNGSGKTAALRMIRNATGLLGERGGHDVVDAFDPRPVEVDGGGDLGRLAAVRVAFGGAAVPKDSPGVLDVRALGWRGHRTWLFDSRVETLRVKPVAFEAADMMDHVQAMMSAKDASHGEAIRRAWTQAMGFAAGVGEHRDPYDADPPKPHLAAIRRELFPDGARPPERWLLVDEPETAVDANSLMTGLALMLDRAEEGRLRVFCASHSPLFAAGLADHPKVQVVEVGPAPWLEAQRKIYDLVRDPERLSGIGARVALDMVMHDAKARAAQALERRAALEREAAAVGAPARAVLLAALASPDGLVRKVGRRQAKPRDEREVNGLRRGPKYVRWDAGEGALRLTDEGRVVAEALLAAAAAAPARAGKPRAPRPMPGDGEVEPPPGPGM